MPLKSIIRRRLLSLLQPWLLEEPHLDLQLGFLRSLAVLTNLRFDVSVLNRLFDAPAFLFFKDLTVERVTLRFSTWFPPAFTIEVHGVCIVQSFEKPEAEGCVTRLRNSKYDYSDYLRKNLSALDPEGCSLHYILERILFSVPEKKKISTSFWNLILKNCHLVAHRIHAEVQFPVLNDEYMCFGEIKEFSARSKYLDKKCLLRGFLSTIFIPMKESTLILKGNGFRVRLIGKNHTDHVLLSSDMQIFIKFRDLKLENCTLCFPELAFSFSPDGISVCLLFHKLLSNKYNQSRSARELWRIAASRIGHVTVTPRLSLHRLVGVIGQWIHYVNAYENILLLIGYSTIRTWKKSISKLSHNKLILSSARRHWELISDIEKKLPVEGISLARRIARHRAALKVSINSHEEFVSTNNFISPFLYTLAYMWKVISTIIHCLANIFSGKKIVQDPDIDGCCLESLIEDPCQSCCFVLNFGKIIMTVSQINEIHPSVYAKLQSLAGIVCSDFLSICFCIDALLLVSVKDIFEQRVFLSCGQMKIESAPLTMSAEACITIPLSSAKGNGKECINHMESIMWVEPAKIFLLSEIDAGQDDDSCDSHIESFMEKLSVSWKGICRKLNENEIEYSENPCLLSKVEISSTYPDHKNPDFGYCECGLMLGKLNLVLTHSSVSLLSVILSQIQHAIYWEDRREAFIASNFVDKAEIPWVNKYDCYSKELIMTLLQKLPEKHIHFGVFVDGPSVRFSHKREANLGGQDIDDIISQDNFDLTFDFHEIEVVVGSPSFGMAPLTGQLGHGNAKAECVKLQPRVIEIPISNNDKFASSGKISIGSYLHLNGINACLEKSEENHQIQLFILKPLTVQILSFRDYIYSLSATMSAFSAASDITAEGFTVLSFLDEVYMIYKAVAGLSSVVSYLFSSFGDADFIHPEIMKQEVLFAAPDSSEATTRGALLKNNASPFFIDVTCRFKSMEIVLHNSRTSFNLERDTTKFDSLTGNKMTVDKLPGCGIWISVQQTTIVISCEEGKMDLLTDLSGILSFVFEYQNSTGNNIDHIVLENLLLRSINCLHEISLSGCSFTLRFGLVQNTSSPGNASKTFGSFNTIGNTSLVRETNLAVFERLRNQSSQSVKNMGSPTNISVPASASYWLLIDVAVTDIFIGRCSLKSDLVQAHKLNKLLSLISIGGEFHTISWEIQGGFIFLETTSLPMAIDNYSSYLHYIGNLTSDAQQPNKSIKKEDHGRENYALDDVIDQGTVSTSQQAASRLPDACDLSLSHFAFVLALENESGGIQEIVVEVDIHLNFELATTGRKLTIDLSRLSILSQVIQGRVENETAIPHFSSVTSKDLSSQLASADLVSGFQNFGELNSISDASSSKNTVSVQLSHQNPILKNLRAFMSLERPDNGTMHLSQCWIGIGSLSGFDMTLSVSEIQTILSMSSSLSGISSQNTLKKLERNHWSTSQEVDNSLEAMIPDGAIVAIQDVDQHMYFAVEEEERTFSVGGVIHYSLVGERSLFRVKHCPQRRWKSTVLWFSFISLFAKNDMGVPLRLNFRPGSCFVDISCTNDGECALWRVYPAQGENYEGVTDSEASNQSMKRTFNLVNKKNDSAISFIDGALEFVRKPGSPIKFKIFNDITAAYGVSETAPRMAAQTTLQTDDESTSWQGGKLPCIDIKIEKFSLNIVHELSDTEYLFPLICLSINNTQLVIQTLATKSRVISTSSAAVHYFDAERNLWGELLHPVEICIFYRSNIQAHLSEYRSHAVPVNFFFRMKELDVYLNENSLDVLLFVIGKLNLSGPYSLRSSIIQANCCKVENQSGLNLVVHFDHQSVTIPRKQSASIVLRRVTDFKNQDSEATSISIQLTDFGSFATSSNHLLLSQTQTLAWRTRIMSTEGSRTFPGPMFVANISRNSEVGLSVVVSPLIIIHNGTGFSMELQFQRLEPKEDEFASLLLRPGDSIDDSMATFDAINFSGGVKRALISLSVGNFLFSFRPRITEELINSESSLSLEWTDYIEGGKAVRLSGLFNKLNYRVRKALFVKSVKCSFSTAHCTLKSEGVSVANLHFLIQTLARNVPVAPEKSAAVFKNENPTVSLLEQKQIYLLPTVRMTNLLHSEIDVILSETDQSNLVGYDKIGKQAVISRGSTVDFYANPEVIYFTVTLTSSNSSSKPVNSGDCMKKFVKQNSDIQHLDINLDFDGGRFFATLRLYRGNRGTLEVVIFTSYSVKNDTDFPIYVLETKRSPLSRIELENLNLSIPSELGLCLPPKSTSSWFLKSERVLLKLLEDHTSEALLDLGSLSGLTEISFEKEERSEIKFVTKLGVSIGPSSGEIVVPSQIVTLVPRYVICNESEDCITVRQWYFQDEVAGVVSINSKQRMPLQLKEGFKKTREFSVFEHFIRKHRSSSDNSLLYIQIQLNEAEVGWSGPVCIASLGHFFLKFRKQANEVTISDNKMTQFAAVHVVEEGSTLVSRFYKPPNMSLPYRIENCLRSLSITYYQKGFLEPEVLGPACSADYVWDDLTLPRRLVIRINGKILEATRPKLFWTPCAAHCLDLMLEDIGKIPKVKRVIQRGIKLVGYIYNHTLALNTMRKFTNKTELVRCGVTRFATTFLTLQRLHKQKANLRRMFTSDEWLKSKAAKEAKGKRATDVVLMPTFWIDVAYTLKAMAPLVRVLRMVDNEKRPAMGYIYEAMDRAKEAIQKAFNGNEEKYKDILMIIDKRWDCQLHHPLHAAGYYLNPEFYYSNPNIDNDGEVMEGLFKCIDKLSQDEEFADKVHSEILTYKKAGGLFGNPTTIRKRTIMAPDSLQLQEIKLDKVRAWKPFHKLGQQRLLAPDLLLDKKSRDQMMSFSEHNGLEMEKVGYEIYADGPTRVLRICEISDSFKRYTVRDLCEKIQLRVSQFAIHLLEHVKQEEDDNECKDFTPIVIAKLGNLHMITVSNNHQTHNQFSLQYMNLELKWNGAPFASMLRRHQLDYSDSNDSVLKVVFVLLASSSNVKQVRYSSIFLQPIDLNLDEETLMKIVSFWRTSLNDSESQRFYFDHFEIHPIKIITNFNPGESRSSYSSTQEALRSLIHSVIKVPRVKNMVVELNGVLITHALITMRELFIKCAQHYSWYTMRAIYIAKGSPLLPPDFVSIFDDLASSSLDVFFDPSRGLTNLPGLTLGTFKIMSKCIKGKGFSGSKRYFGDLGKTLRSAGSNLAFAAVAEISDYVLKGAEANGLNGLVSGFHQGILKLAMEPSVLGTALMEGGSDRKILLDRSPGVDELYIEGYIQAMLDTVYRQEYLRVRVVDNQVILKNLPPNHSLINEITDRVKEFLVSKALLKGDPSTTSRPLSRLRGESEWRIGPTVLTLCEHLFVSFAIRILRRQANKFIFSIKWGKQSEVGSNADVPANSSQKVQKVSFIRKWGVGKFLLSGLLAYIDGRLCRGIPNPVARRVVSGFLLSFIDQNDDE